MATFGEFIIASSGMSASQMALNITGQNISNINTPGYTRRSLDQATFILNGSGLYRSSNTVSAGAGVMMQGISQLRDPYLDIRFRNEMSSVGSTDALLGGMEQIQQVINDVNKNGITTQFQDLLSMFGKLDANNVGTKEFDTLVRDSAESLCQLLNQAASKLQGVMDNYENKYKEEVDVVDTLVQNIRKINEQIRKADISGDQALELRDERNLMLDELSQYMKVDITYGTEKLGTGVEIEKLTIKMVDDNTGKPSYTLVDGINSASISIKDPDAKDFTIVVGELQDKNGKTVLDDKGQPILNGDVVDGMGYGALESMRQILTGEGTFSANNDETCGIPYYMKSLDLLANKFAEAMNDLNMNDKDGNTMVGVIAGSGALFETSDGSAKITAGNISISDDWRNGIVEVVTSTDPSSGTTANDNISRFQNLFNKDFEFEAETNGVPNGNIIYKGNFEGYYANMQAILGSDVQSISSMYDTYATSADELNNSRDGVSGVDLNEEGVNMIQYQKAFAASCRMMTALDELMDKVINGMGVVGR